MKRPSMLLLIAALLAGCGMWLLLNPSSPSVPAALPSSTDTQTAEEPQRPATTPTSLATVSSSAAPSLSWTPGAVPSASISPPYSMPTMTITPDPHPTTLQLGTRDQSTPDAAAKGFAVRFFSLDTSVDHSPGAGPARAALLATPALATQFVQAPGGGRTGAQWGTLVKYHGVQRATVKLVNLGDIPPDTTTTAIRTAQVHIEAHGSGGWYSIRTQLFNVTLTRAGVWEVSGYQLVN